MSDDKNVSPVGWYLASYLLRFVELKDKRRNDDEKRFVSWENTILVKATSVDHAYDKTLNVARKATRPYKGGPHAIPVQWQLLGVTEILPIYEPIEDGAEIAWTERSPRKLRLLKRSVRRKGELRQ